jgi:DNA-directed RNA polymerase specialized sigma24 family protein
MLMKTRPEPIDFHLVDAKHHAIHKRLENWARYVSVRRPQWMGPIWKMGKSHGRQWHAPELSDPLDQLDGHTMEKAVADLPAKNRDALRWSYVFKTTPAVAARELAVTYEVLAALVHGGRTMLVNRRK